MSDQVRNGPSANPFSAVLPSPPAATERATPTRHQAEEAITSGQSSIDPEHVAKAAYYRAEQRGFAPGQELEDWLKAERELQDGPDSEDVSGS